MSINFTTYHCFCFQRLGCHVEKCCKYLHILSLRENLFSSKHEKLISSHWKISRTGLRRRQTQEKRRPTSFNIRSKFPMMLMDRKHTPLCACVTRHINIQNTEEKMLNSSFWWGTRSLCPTGLRYVDAIYDCKVWSVFLK